jgi:hypothetical protein
MYTYWRITTNATSKHRPIAKSNTIAASEFRMSLIRSSWFYVTYSTICRMMLLVAESCSSLITSEFRMLSR